MDQIWCARNNKVHNNVFPDIPCVLGKIQRSISNHLRAWSDLEQCDSWCCPPLGAFKLNFDVAVRSSYMVAGAVISDHEGEMIFASAKLLPLLDINAGEAQAALLALEVASQLPRHSRVFLEGDSLITILAINNPISCSEWSSVSVIKDVIFCFLLSPLGLRPRSLGELISGHMLLPNGPLPIMFMEAFPLL
jgi:hypothetical protein